MSVSGIETSTTLGEHLFFLLKRYFLNSSSLLEFLIWSFISLIYSLLGFKTSIKSDAAYISLLDDFLIKSL